MRGLGSRRFGGVSHSDLQEEEPSQSSSTSESTHDQDAEEENRCFGTFQGTIVGLRYYTGTVNRGEMVALVRQPQNPYDRNAVMVANVYGSQVGHIKKELAAALAFIMDRNLARVEGVVPYGKTNSFTMTVTLTFWGREENQEAVHSQMKNHGYKLNAVKGSSSAASWDRYGGAGSSSEICPVILTQEELKNAFDKLFDDLLEDRTREMEAAEAVRTPLLLHQKQALYWMTSRENSSDLPPFWEQRSGLYFNVLTNFGARESPESVLGGILADDMGLGKTLTTIALILSNFHNGKPLPVKYEGGASESRPSTSSTAHPAQKGASRRKEDSPKPLQTLKRSHKESDRTAASEDDDDVVVVSETRADQKPTASQPKRQTVKLHDVDFGSALDSSGSSLDSSRSASAKSRMKKGSGQTVKLHDVDFGSALDSSGSSLDSSRSASAKSRMKKGSGTSKKSPRPTLIICPLSVLTNWMDQFEQHLREDVQLNLYLFYGPDRCRQASFLSEQDVVLTTYNVLTSEYGKNSVLQKVLWLRVVLDEGHIIRNPDALQSKAVLSLNAERRWILSGTPIQNSVKDVWMLMCFLRLKPFAVREWWMRVIQRPVMMGNKEGLKNLQALLKVLTMRRTKLSKANGRPILQLPEKKVFLQKVVLSKEERERYELEKAEGRRIISRYMADGTVLRNYADVLAILVRLRLLCCHCDLVGKLTETAGTADSSSPAELRERLISKIRLVLSSGVDEECAVCLDSLRQPVITHCAHVFCKPCICEVIQSKQLAAKCPLCRANIKSTELLEYPGDEEDSRPTDRKDQWRSSSKVEALMTVLLKLRSEDPTIKSLVVSQFTKFLNILEVPLRESKFSFTRLDGTMNQKARARAVSELQDPSPGSPTVMLLSLKAGGVGLNLTGASRVFLMEPAWNPAVEEQCIDRCHRLGQTRDVVVTKFVVKDSVEESMLKIQKRKQELVQKLLGAKSTEDRKQERIQEIRTLMDI
ncbi:helicase-like transcription factor isoform X1 [Astyanax mexicanus]|uniref:helicase-like transcription factor isoform X1 n=1 Tax=Astyanax mexicanus TaxID=7994 RepID=UPI0020CB3314|nr:helicase-like transcription factor isoform X1 [Astyanax mexicanus]XP_049322792.1 helicase-like transcription factor isoform X1 [Astyanax mexicanus]